MLEEWRGVPDKEADWVVGIADALDAVLLSLGLADQISEEEMREAWVDVVGEFLASHSEPAGLKRGVLTIRVLQPTVRYELETKWKAKVLDNLQKRFGGDKVRSLRFH